MKTILIAGEPGSGKSTLMRALMGRLGPSEPLRAGLARGHAWPQRGVYVLGLYEGRAHEGTDALSMSAMPYIRALLRALPQNSTLITEGDRVTNAAFIRAAQAQGPLEFIILEAEGLLASRCAARGSMQASTWAQGVRTKLTGLTGAFEHEVVPHRTPADTTALVERLLG